jgi:NADP-dependent 3-hydroxy acid dehydrogenase YdfG/Tfp pilus assembly protein PilF
MSNHTVYIFYAEENKIEAELLSSDFQKAKLSCNIDLSNHEKIQQLKENEDTTALLLISDNFLRSIELTQYLEQLMGAELSHQVSTVLTHGRRLKEKEGTQMEVYPTKIKTLNNVMFYRDFWYEKWITLRKKAKQATGNEQIDYNQQKEIAKKMSVGSISTYIRQINNSSPFDWDSFGDDNYQAFFDKICWIPTAIANDVDQQELNSEPQEDTTTLDTTESTVPEKPQEIITEADSAIKNNADSELIQEELEIELAQLPSEKEALTHTEIPSETVTPPTQEQPKDIAVEEVPEVKEPTPEHSTESSQNLATESNDANSLFEEAAQLTESTEFEAAKQVYLRILQNDPYNGKALIWLSRLLAAHFPEEVQAAANAYRKSIMVNDEDADLYYEYGMLQKEQLQSYSRAADAFKSALEIDSLYEEAYLGLAFCQKEMGMKAQAKANYLQACILHADRFETADNDAHFGVIRVQEAETDVQPDIERPQNSNAETVVLITGASAGIGKSIAKQFIMNGFRVIITARRKERLERFKNEMETAYQQANVLCLPFDICNIDAVKSALDNLAEPWSKIDILINNAGLAKGFAPVQEGNIDHWEAMINTNVKGLLYMSRMITPGMVERNRGHVVNLSSVAGTQVYSGGGAYCATKAAVDSLTRSMRLDLYKHNIKVSSISPGHVDSTEFATVRYEDPNKTDIYKDFKPLCAQDVAETVYYVVTRPQHVNIQDVLIFGTQQASVRDVNRSGRNDL